MSIHRHTLSCNNCQILWLHILTFLIKANNVQKHKLEGKMSWNCFVDAFLPVIIVTLFVVFDRPTTLECVWTETEPLCLNYQCHCCMWRPEDDISCLPPSFPALFLGSGSFTEASDHWLARLVDQLAPEVCLSQLYLCFSLGPGNLNSNPQLNSKCFTLWVLSPDQPILFI